MLILSPTRGLNDVAWPKNSRSASLGRRDLLLGATVAPDVLRHRILLLCPVPAAAGRGRHRTALPRLQFSAEHVRRFVCAPPRWNRLGGIRRVLLRMVNCLWRGGACVLDSVSRPPQLSTR